MAMTKMYALIEDITGTNVLVSIVSFMSILLHEFFWATVTFDLSKKDTNLGCKAWEN